MWNWKEKAPRRLGYEVQICSDMTIERISLDFDVMGS